MATLDLNKAPRTAVFRATETILKTDPTLNRVVNIWRFWREAPGQNAPFGIDQLGKSRVAIRVSPTTGPNSWTFPEAFVGPLFLNFECLILGADADDPFNLWWAIQRAIYPQSNPLQNIAALQAAGAHTGLYEFTIPCQLENPDSELWKMGGQARIAVREQMTS
jgi:hypothetical protein